MSYLSRIALIMSVLLLPSTRSSAQDVAVRRVTKHVITLSMSNLGMHTNITVIETAKGLVAVETEITPYIMGKIKEAAEKELGRSDWAYVINTHGHLHHSRGNAAFQGVQVVGHERLNMDRLKRALASDQGRRAYCRDVGTDAAISQLRRTLAQARLTAAQRAELRRRLRFCQAVQNEILAGFEVVNPTLTFHDRYALDLGDVHLRLTYWGDGINHSSIFIHVVEDRLLVGMGMAGAWLPDFYGRASLAGVRQAISVWKELSEETFPVDVMIGIHKAEPITSRTHFRHRYEYVQALLDDVTTARQQGLTLEQAQDRLSLEKRYASVRDHFSQPQDMAKRHRNSIATIWALLQAETSSSAQI